MSTSSFDIRKQLAALPFWDHLSVPERETMSDCAQIKRYRTGELIYSRDQECLGMIRVLNGSVRAFMLSEEGREILLYRIEGGMTDVLSASCVMNEISFESQMVADTDCELLIVPAVCLSSFKQNNVYVRCFIFETLGKRFSDVMHEMQNILFSSVGQRVAAALLARADRSKDNAVSATHEQVAREISSSREVVSRTLKEMERQGMVSLRRGRIILNDLRALAQTADGFLSLTR